MKKKGVFQCFFYSLVTFFLFFPVVSFADDAYDRIEVDENTYIHVWDTGYSDWMVASRQEQLSGDWAAAIKYEGIAPPTDEAMWLQDEWVFPYWESNSQFRVVKAFTSRDTNGDGLLDYGEGAVTNGSVQITVKVSALDEKKQPLSMSLGLSPAVDDYASIEELVVKQTYEIENVGNTPLKDVSFFQMLHAQPEGDWRPNTYGL